jgi:hypothetical protein
MIRITSSIGRLVAVPQSKEAAEKITTHVIRNRLRPKRWPNHAVLGMIIAFEIR